MRNKSKGGSAPVPVCFIEQNPISLNYLAHVLRGHEFEVVGEEVAFERRSSSLGGKRE
jgi:hypothetical protein